MEISNQHTVGKWEQRVWMVCFWTTFLTLLWQLSFTGLAFWGLSQNRNPIPWPTGARFVWWFAAEYGLILDNLIGVLLAPFGLYAFAKARTRGLRLRWPFNVWLFSHLALTVTLLVCLATLWLEGAANYRMLSSMFILRVIFNNAPLIALVAGLAAIYFLPKGTLDKPVVEEPIDPLA
jgi:hypothetical protein